MSLEDKLTKLKELRAKQIVKVTPEIRESISTIKEEIINLVKEL